MTKAEKVYLKLAEGELAALGVVSGAGGVVGAGLGAKVQGGKRATKALRLKKTLGGAAKGGLVGATVAGGTALLAAAGLAS